MAAVNIDDRKVLGNGLPTQCLIGVNFSIGSVDPFAGCGASTTGIDSGFGTYWAAAPT